MSYMTYMEADAGRTMWKEWPIEAALGVVELVEWQLTFFHYPMTAQGVYIRKTKIRSTNDFVRLPQSWEPAW
jgi:hypothetical protein